MFCVIEHSRVVIAFFIPRPRETPSKHSIPLNNVLDREHILSHIVNRSNVFTECDQVMFSLSHIQYFT